MDFLLGSFNAFVIGLLAFDFCIKSLSLKMKREMALPFFFIFPTSCDFSHLTHQISICFYSANTKIYDLITIEPVVSMGKASRLPQQHAMARI